MNLIEILNKRKNGEDLTNEELAILEQYDESLKVHKSEIEKLKAEKEAFETKLSNAQTELQDKMRILSEKEEEAKRLTTEKEEIETIYKNAKSAEEARIILEKAKADKEKAEAIKKIEQDRIEKEKQEQEKYEKMVQELKELKEKNSIAGLKEKILLEKTNKPYLETGLNNILNNISNRTLQETEMALNILLSMYDHEVEMKKWESSKKASSSILDNKNITLVDTTEKTKKETTEDEILSFAKKAGFKVRK